jgi:uncharacterized RDD family membrane protein YckC
MARSSARETASTFTAASWARRFAAWLIDITIVVVIPIFTVALVASAVSTDEATGEGVAYLAGFALLILMPIYFALFHAGRRGQTPGKRVTGIAVRDMRTGAQLGHGAAFGRAYFMFAMYLAGGVGLLLDGLWPLWDKRKQALHDKVVSSVVVRISSPQLEHPASAKDVHRPL